MKEHISLLLGSILVSITWVARSTCPHLMSKTQMKYVLECFGTQSIQLVQEGILNNQKEQLTKCKIGRKNKFGYGSIIFSFFLYTVLMIIPLNISHTGNPLIQT